VKEKAVAARRSGVKIIIFPSANKRDYLELPPHVKEGLEVHFVNHYSEIFTLAFEDKPDAEKQLACKESGRVSHGRRESTGLSDDDASAILQS
jgi:Lon-like ATP-dependent protease